MMTIGDLTMEDARLDDLLQLWLFELCAHNVVGNNALPKEVGKCGTIVYQCSTSFGEIKV